METPKSPSLLLQAEKVLPQPAHPHLIACCPTMDLVAVVNQDEQVNVYRFGGQRALGLQRRNASTNVVSICWKFNGQYLAVGWSDGVVEVISAETGNVQKHFTRVTTRSGDGGIRGFSSKSITCIGWGLNFIDVPAVKTKTGLNSKRMAPDERLQFSLDALTTDHWNDGKESASLDDFLDRIPDPKKVEIPVDLPEQLARIDVTSLFPKLPILPLLPPAAYKLGEHPAAELFATQASLDAALHTNSDRDLNGLDTLLLSHDDGSVHLILYDALSLGSVGPPVEWKFKSLNHLQHASHPFGCSHMFLAEIPSEMSKVPPKIALIPLSLRFLPSAGSLLHMIESRTAQLETLVQYVSECLLALHHHWKHANDLPKRFMEGVNETLLAKQDPTLVQSLFHLSATGDCPPTLKEWLVDILTERGHKRWDHAMSFGYTKVVDITHENLLPALDRCTAILAGLKGLAQYHEDSTIFNVPLSSFGVIIDIIRCMRLLGHHILIYATEEQRQFSTFSKWLRHEIDIQATDPSSASAEETAERDMGIDYSQLLAYIQGAMCESRIDPFVWIPDDPPAVSAHSGMYEDVMKALDRFKNGTDGDREVLNLQSHFNEWKRHNRILVDQITSHQRANSSMSFGMVLEESKLAAWDMRMVFKDLRGVNIPNVSPEKDLTTYCAFITEDRLNEARIHHVVHSDMLDGPKAVRQMLGVIIRFDITTEVRAVKFVDDEQMMLLVKAQEGEVPQKQLPAGKAGRISSLLHLSTEQMQPHIVHTFPPEERFKPLKVEVNGRRSRRFVTVIAEDLRYLRIFDLDFKAEDEDGYGRVRDDEDDLMID